MLARSCFIFLYCPLESTSPSTKLKYFNSVTFCVCLVGLWKDSISPFEVSMSMVATWHIVGWSHCVHPIHPHYTVRIKFFEVTELTKFCHRVTRDRSFHVAISCLTRIFHVSLCLRWIVRHWLWNFISNINFILSCLNLLNTTPVGEETVHKPLSPWTRGAIHWLSVQPGGMQWDLSLWCRTFLLGVVLSCLLPNS